MVRVLLSPFAMETLFDDAVTATPWLDLFFFTVKVFWPSDKLVICKLAVIVRACLPLFIPKLMHDGLNNASIEAAPATLRRPVPTSSTPAWSVESAEAKTVPSAEFTSADFIWSGVQSGWSCFKSAAEPVTCGVAWLVPLTARNPVGSETPSELHVFIAPE